MTRRMLGLSSVTALLVGAIVGCGAPNAGDGSGAAATTNPAVPITRDGAPPPPTVTDGCVANVDNDPMNCGSCGNVCPSGVACVAGVCQCPTPLSACSRECVHLGCDPMNCGTCGHACPSGIECVDGKCACPDGQTACGDQCTDTTSDPANCGGCGTSCGAEFTCSSGQCSGSSAPPSSVPPIQ